MSSTAVPSVPTIRDSQSPPSFPTADPSLRHQDNKEDLIHLVPVTDEAKQMFNSVCWHSECAHLDEHHRKFLPDLSNSEYDYMKLLVTLDPPNKTQEEMGGYWRIGIDDPTLQPFNWIFGKGDSRLGNQNIDVKLVSNLQTLPNQTFYCEGAAYVKAKHFRIFMHKSSGVFVLEALEPLEMDGKVMRRGRMSALMKPITQIKIDVFVANIVFKVDTYLKETDHVRRRNTKLGLCNKKNPVTRISGIPMAHDNLIPDQAVFRQPIGHGTFGQVYEGFSPSGSLRAIKCITLNKEKDRVLFRDEREALEKCRSCKNIVNLFGVFNSRGGRDEGTSGDGALPCAMYLIQERGIPLYQVKFDKISTQGKVHLTKGLLQALAFLKQNQMLHRDITPQNVIVTGVETKYEIKLIDFGKVVFGRASTSTNIAAQCFLPPEISPGKAVFYSHELDMYMAGHVLARCFAQEVFGPNGKWRDQRNPREWPALKAEMTSPPCTNNGMGPLMTLLAEMMAWEPRSRPQPAKALENNVFDPNRVYKLDTPGFGITTDLGKARLASVARELNEQNAKRRKPAGEAKTPVNKKRKAEAEEEDEAPVATARKRRAK